MLSRGRPAGPMRGAAFACTTLSVCLAACARFAAAGLPKCQECKYLACPLRFSSDAHCASAASASASAATGLLQGSLSVRGVDGCVPLLKNGSGVRVMFTQFASGLAFDVQEYANGCRKAPTRRMRFNQCENKCCKFGNTDLFWSDAAPEANDSAVLGASRAAVVSFFSLFCLVYFGWMPCHSRLSAI